MTRYTLFLLLLLSCTHRTHQPLPANHAGWRKLAFSINDIEKNGQSGIEYEFCIQNTAAAKAEVRKCDPLVQFSTSPGRVGCRGDLILCLSNTRDSVYRERLWCLCQLEGVQRIQQTHWE